MRLSDVQARGALWLLVGWAGIVGLAGCAVFSRGGGESLPREIERAPVFELDATAQLDSSGQALMEVRMTVPTSLTGIRQTGSGTAARVRWTIEILTRPDGQQVYEASWVETVGVSDSTAEAPIVSRVIEVPSGETLVAVTAEDEATGVGYTERQDVLVPTPSGPAVVTGLRVEVHNGAVWRPLVSRTVTVDWDSLRVLAQVVNGDGGDARVVVERLDADSSVALPPFAMGRQPGSLPVRGVRVDKRIQDTTFVHETRVADEPVDLATPIPPLGTGAYRLRVEAGDAVLDRFMIVRRAGFPAVERVGDLVAAMRYITTDGEMRALTARLDPFLQRRAFDRFWGDRIPDRRLAASTVRAYAERVEAANRRFSNQKEGWKTDRGMAYVLFGPPQRVEQAFRTERWIYTSGPVSGLALEFEATPDLPDGWPHEVWVLRRGPAYDVAWQRARRAWRRGDVP
ncbi:MAG: hypothetical protein Rubg2KO_18870 [Rubricoccaceae bacterium]